MRDRLLEAVGSWPNELGRELEARHGRKAGALLARYERAFDEAYQVIVEPALAANDIADLERLSGQSLISWGRPSSDGVASYLKIFRRGAKVAISEIAPVLVHFSFEIEDEHSFELDLPDGEIFLHVFRLKTANKRLFSSGVAEDEALCTAIAAALEDAIEHDALNGLMTLSGLDLRTTSLLRCYRNYARQIAAINAHRTANATLLKHPEAARLLARLFAARLDPANASTKEAARTAAAFDAYLGGVSAIQEDRVLRIFRNLVEATVRTSFYRAPHPDLPADSVAIKIDCSAVDKMPAPRPWREIYVYGGASMEGAHLRGGPVARGGLRWSERPDDFRTEVLGLVKTQITKNAQIVPTGAKGCFIVKRLPAKNPGEEVRRCYRILIRSLLEMQDNLVKGKIVRPARVVARDGDDPYLVVAADKGTATFSDTANALSKEYGFWLDDAFASGGSNGYDHKKEAITATGAWVSVERHFRDLGIDIKRTTFTAVGVGDMSGDVFGNGALLSRNLRLVAAFDWRDIFIDPNPDAARSFAERKRLFALPRSSWQDYRREAISKGGGVFPRSMKRIPLSEEARRALGVEAKELDPDALIRAIFTAPVDLLYNGGIGTYVKASYQSHADVGDPQNDALRVDASALRCRLIGEGGNLGFTQEARIEFAQKGGRNFTDAMDNSGGVDLSDHEVNLKILIDGGKKRTTPAERTRLLKRFKQPIIADVLRDNYLQTLAVSLDARRSRENLPLFSRTIADLERRGLMNATLEGLPDAETLRQRGASGEGLVPPELCVLLSWSKIDMKARILDSPIIASPQMTRYMKSYFAPEIRKHFGEAITQHRLKDQILVTAITNSVVNLHGAAALNRLTTELGLAASRVVEGLLVAREILEIDPILESLFKLDGKVASSLQYDEILAAEESITLAARWLIRSVPDLRNKMDEARARYANLAERIAPLMRRDLPESDRAGFLEAIKRRVEAGIPPATAERLALLEHVPTILDAIRIADARRLPLKRSLRLLYEVGDRLRLGAVIAGLKTLPRRSDWDGSAVADVIAELRRSRRRIAEKLVEIDVSIDDYMEKRHRSSAALMASIARIETEKPSSIAPFVVVSNQIQNLAAL
jgi:glutamate dehydrogenase